MELTEVVADVEPAVPVVVDGEEVEAAAAVAASRCQQTSIERAGPSQTEDRRTLPGLGAT